MIDSPVKLIVAMEFAGQFTLGGCMLFPDGSAYFEFIGVSPYLNATVRVPFEFRREA